MKILMISGAVASIQAPIGTEPGFINNSPNPELGIPFTVVGADPFNQTFAELENVITAAGLTPSATTYNQIATAIPILAQSVAIGGNTTGYVNVTSSRALNTAYTNSTGRSIFVTVSAVSTATAALIPTVSGVALPQGTASTAGLSLGVQFMVQPGATYKVAISAGTGTLNAWCEL